MSVYGAFWRDTTFSMYGWTTLNLWNSSTSVGAHTQVDVSSARVKLSPFCDTKVRIGGVKTVSYAIPELVCETHPRR